MARQLFCPEEHRRIYYELTADDDPYSFPVRGMLSLIMSDKIKTGKVFVDDWPRYSSIACLQESLEYSEIDTDTLTIYSKSEQKFDSFFRWIKTVRKWQSRTLLIQYLRKDFVGLARQELSNVNCNDLGSLIIYGRQMGNELLQMHSKYVKEELKKHPGFYLSPLGQDDVQTVVDLYPSPIPAKEGMFRWMLSNLPSSSIRDPQHRLVAFCITYSCGAGGILYVMPEHRRSGLAMCVGVDLVVEQSKLYPGQQFGAVSPDNTASIELNNKLNAPRTDALANWVIFTPNKTSKL